jgi:hypothetical protein
MISFPVLRLLMRRVTVVSISYLVLHLGTSSLLKQVWAKGNGPCAELMRSPMTLAPSAAILSEPVQICKNTPLSLAERPSRVLQRREAVV